MSPVPPPAKVLVTGANGYIAAWVVRTLLEQGYSVRGTVRTASKGDHLKKIFSSYGDKFELVVVEDITKDGAFDEAVKGVDLVEHTASPFHFNINHPDDLIVPAVKGTTSILNSILKNGSSVKRVVLTASCACVLKPGIVGKWDETSWNEPSILEVQEKGTKAPGIAMYRASKTLAEKAAWEFVETHKGEIGWDLAVLNPPFVFGPPIHEVTSLDSLNTSMLDFFKAVVKGAKTNDELASQGSALIDVRDLGLAHVLAAQKAEAGGERIIVSGGPFFWQELVDVANSIQPPIIAGLPKGVPGATKGKQYIIDYETAKSDRILGLKTRSFEETVRDILVDVKNRGYV
ncbi:D-lactaldehyde dehydrogenase [Dentipellis sp. KUC8613]|nr:D-lactaldehyde dehydrogenase [Dentipellis sp. KUC8613]